MNVSILSAFEDSMRKETGGSVRTYNLAKALQKTGANVQVILPNFKQCSEKIENLTVHKFKGFIPKAILRAVGKKLGIARPTSFYFYDLTFVLKATRAMQKANVVQIEQPILGIAFIALLHRLMRKTVALDCHDVFQAKRIQQTGLFRRIIETSLEKLAYNSADVILAVSEKEKQILIDNGVSLNKIFVTPNGVDTSSFQIAGESEETLTRYELENSHVVVFLGNLTYLPNREAIELISTKIAPKVIAEDSSAKFVIVGKNSEGLSFPNIKFTGFVDNLPEMLASSKVGIAPLLHGSGTRLKILEYFSCGLPVVSTSVGAEGLQVKHEQNILLADDPESFASEIVRLLRDNELCVTLSKAGKETAKMYDWKKIAQKLAIDYQNFIDAKPKAS